MKLDSLDRRLAELETKQSALDRQVTRAILAKLTVEELRRLGDICLRTDEWQKEPTEEEACFLAELKGKYAI